MIRNPNMFAEMRDRLNSKVFNLVGTGAPQSGTVGYGSGAGVAGKGSRYTNISNGVEYINEGDRTTPYWTPLNFNHPNLLGVYDDFRHLVGKALLNADAVAFLPTGLRIHGSGVADDDSGIEVVMGENGPVATATTTDEDNHLVALSALSTDSGAGPFQPDTNGVMVIDVNVSMLTAITLRRFFVGFLGTFADALVSPVTGATTVLTLVQDDLAGLFYDSIMTDADRLYAPHNKSNAAATIATTATGVDTGVDFPAAATYARLRVEIHTDGTMVCFKDKEQITVIENALDVDEEVAPVCLIASNSAVVKAMLIKHFMTFATKG